jgi:GNAT superfamily N-acetyltransferase
VTDFAIRQAEEKDVPALARLRCEYAEEEDGPLTERDYEQRFVDWYRGESGHRITWLAERDGTPIGMMSFVVFRRMPRPGKPATRWGYLSNAFVLAPYRNRGVGGQLMAALLRYADEHGFARVVLRPSDRAVPFYQRSGFGPADMLMARVPDN